MFTIAMTELGALCKTCVGIYIASTLVAVGGVWQLFSASPSAPSSKAPGRGALPVYFALGLLALAVTSALPALTYASTAPDHTPFLRGCGAIKVAPEKKHALLLLPGSQPTKSALFFEDPLCPTCRAFHSRLAAEGALEKLDVQVALMPLDSECNWMLAEPMHPGACMVSRALICAEDPKAALNWAFAEQEALAEAGKAGEPALRALIGQRFGAGIDACLNSPKTKQRLNKHLHFAAENNIPLSTPQMYLGSDRVCDEDTDIGLSFTLHHLAPELAP